MNKRRTIATIGIASLLLATIAFFLYTNKTRKPPEAVVVNEQGLPLMFQAKTDVIGSDIQLLHLALMDDSPDNDMLSKSSDYKNYNDARNILFVNGIDKPSVWLFKEHNQRITRTIQLNGEDNDSNQANPRKTIALYFESVANQKNGTHLQTLNADLTKIDGSQNTRVLTDVERILSVKLTRDSSNIDIIYQKSNTLYHALYNTATFKLQGQQTLGEAQLKP